MYRIEPAVLNGKRYIFLTICNIPIAVYFFIYRLGQYGARFRFLKYPHRKVVVAL